ncbi:hypothetical protein ASF87_12990 [Microbacterium sp. Leaf161]|nr:hypothetical protein ASF87_12990 [Microbacterium sp. Leaf161]
MEPFQDLERGGRIVALWAPAGAGKTAIIGQWIDTLDRPVEIVDCSEAARVTSAICEVRAGSRSHLVLDRVELATAATRAEILQLLEDTTATAGIVLAGRFDPFPVSPSRWVVTTEIREADLEFTPAEVHEFFGIDAADADHVRKILAVTHGWPVALALLSRLAQEAEMGDVLSRFNGDSRPIAEYLVHELLDRLPPPQRDVLVWSAVAREVPALLLDELTEHNDAAGILDHLARSNTLVAVESNSYVFHPLLATFLRAEQRHRDIERARQGHARAAEWFTRHGDLRSALDQWEHAADQDALAAFLDAHGYSLIFQGESGAVMRAVRALPSRERERLDADMRLLLGVPHFDDRNAARRRLAARTAARRGTKSPVDEIVDRLWAHASGEDVVSIPAAVGPSDTPLAVDVQAFGDIADAWVHEDARENDGRLRKAERLIALGAHLRSTGTERWLRLLALESALSVVATAGQWIDVEAVFLALSKELIDDADAADGVAARAAFAVAAQAYHQGRALPVASLRPLIDKRESPVEGTMQHLARVLLALDALERHPGHETLNALTTVMEEDLADSMPSVAYAVVPWMYAAMWHGDLTLADRILFRVRRVLGSDRLETLTAAFMRRPSRETEMLLRRGIESGAMKVSPLTVSYAWVYLATYAEQHGKKAASTERVLNALMAAAPLGAIRPFLQEGNQPALLLRARADRLGSWQSFADTVVDRAAIPVPEATNLPALTLRERELVRELPAHQSLADIATERQVSINTVKSQLRSIYSKLGAANRAEAVAAARELGLV